MICFYVVWGVRPSYTDAQGIVSASLPSAAQLGLPAEIQSWIASHGLRAVDFFWVASNAEDILRQHPEMVW